MRYKYKPPYDARDVVGVHPNASASRTMFGKAPRFISVSGVDNSLPYSSEHPLVVARLKILAKHKALNPKPTIEYVPQVRPEQILGFDTNTRSAVHDTDGKHTPGVTARVTFGVQKHRAKRASANQSFPTG